MGLSSKQVSGDGLGWSETLLQGPALELPKPPPGKRQQQSQQKQSEALKCPRCDSTNTKFCYYNNYNKSQPRHFCKSCKRHWTKGGTLRNVPVGGGRKNKRIKTIGSGAASSVTNSSPATAAAITSLSGPRPSSAVTRTDGASFCNRPIDNYKATQPPQKIPDPLNYQHLLLPDNCTNLDSKGFSSNDGVFVGSALSLPQNQGLQFPFSSSSSGSFDTNPSSISTSFQSSSVYNYTGETLEDPTISSSIAKVSTSMPLAHPWQLPITSSEMNISSYWNWDDIDALVSTDLNMPWDDDPEIKP